MDGRIAPVYFHLSGPGDKIKETVKAGRRGDRCWCRHPETGQRV